jgi:organic radical activating enzyme
MPHNGRWAVQEVFHTIQGEGPHTGLPAVFVRMRHCNLRCTFCDTDFTSGTLEPTTDELLRMIEAARAPTAASNSTRLVVITGGEPMLQDLGHLVVPIITQLHMAVQIETAGTVWPESFDSPMMRQYLDMPYYFSIVCSPKTPKVHPSIEQHCQHWKYIVRAEGALSAVDGLPDSGTQPSGSDAPLYRPRERALGDPRRATIWVQPCEEYAVVRQVVNGKDIPPARDANASARALTHAAQIAMNYGHRLSLQTHKLLGLP